MSRIDDLIRDLCPGGVEYKSLGEVGHLLGGLTGKTKADFVDGTARYVSYKNVYSNLQVDVTADDFVRISDSETQNTLRIGDILFTGSSENREEVGLTSVVTSPPRTPLYLNSFCICFRPNKNFTLLPEFAKHLFRSGNIRQQVIKTATGVTRINISRKNLAKIQLPLPPAEVQQEVARTLDQFTQLEAELEAELEARKQQYAYYRDILVAPRSPRESVKLGEVSHIARGASPRPIRKFITDDGGIPWIKIGDVPPQGKYVTATAQHISTDGAEKSRQIKPGDFILSNSMSFGRPYISKINGCIHDGWLVISNYEKTFDPDFLYHVLRSSPIQNGFTQRAGSGTVRNLNSRIVSETLVPAPPIDQQREIVHLLDKFDLLVNDLTSGLPAEIEARRKQYEHYRDRLLTFPEKK